MKNRKYKKIIEVLGKERIKSNEPLAKHTTFKIGGPADLFYEAKTEEELIRIIRIIREAGVPYFILGNGSNLLVSDKGFRGLVIKNSVSGIRIIGESRKPVSFHQVVSARHFAVHPEKYLKLSDLDYPDEPLNTEIEVFSGTLLQILIKWCLDNGMTGLQWFAGIPASVGGAIVHNCHGGKKLISSYLKKIKVLDMENNIKEIKKEEIKFNYDFSDIPQKGLLILRAYMLLAKGDIKKARYVYKEWLKRKLRLQPQKKCPGSIFENVPEKLAEHVGAPTLAAGWFIDQCGLKGKKIGKAQISEKHANFIINLGRAKAADVVALIELVRQKVKEKFGIELKEEIVRLGEF